ncbi:Thioesterase/thiol ester dehydrase-isomerase [Nadsonia fulvescens var. elongata DSM 6958]|uniref:Thioesterase/thiol ester dehydrase-isomerase n=1 Tax=Nadsonia fulvescens var. elongata DSM 6958 TaxID=857566 RepID=A0A1E3PCG9_9ASCO|nr:Thioesterase/thiol ester dehydrase-isomerase [Nadsonia fulvescens var. elongata DSM 6958]
MKPLTTRSFSDLLAYLELHVATGLEATGNQLKERYFRSSTIPYQAKVATGVFGGHILAQSLWVAAATVPSKEFICHNLTGYFLRPGLKDVPFYYHITVSRDGKSYATREIKVYQPTPKDIDRHNTKNHTAEDTKGQGLIRLIENNPQLWKEELSLAFIGVCSFKRPLRDDDPKVKSLVHQPQYLEPQYLAASLDGIKTQDGFRVNHEMLPLAPDSDSIEWTSKVDKLIEDGHYAEPIHPIELRKLNLDEYNADVNETSNRRVVHYLKSLIPLSKTAATGKTTYSTDDINLQVAALIYTSDRNSMFTVLNAHSFDREEYRIGRIASISHNFVLHNMTKLPLVDSEHWSMMESWTDATGDGRGLYNGRVYDKDGVLTCSFMQDGVMELFKKDHSKI